MLPRNVRKYLFDIRQACRLLHDFTVCKRFADYEVNPLLRSSVERQFEIIGEALRQAIELPPDLASAINDSRQIITFRNRSIHGYASVSNEVVWGIVERNLPVLSQQVKLLLTDHS